jgi:hypothetical protein
MGATAAMRNLFDPREVSQRQGLLRLELDELDILRQHRTARQADYERGQLLLV